MTQYRDQVEERAPQHQAESAHAFSINDVDGLSTVLAHELKQPLSAIVNGVEACARYVRSGKGETDKILKLLEDASAQAFRAARIVEHLRGLMDRRKPDRERTDLCEIVRNVSRYVDREVHEEGIRLRLDLPPGPIPIHVDGVQIEQVIVNLLQNAIDAVREAPGDCHEIQVQVRAEKGMGEVTVCDTGVGVSDAALGRVFEAFFTTKSHGSGMGLAISRFIVEAHGGRICVTRRADACRGTTVGFSLPLGAPAHFQRRPHRSR